MECLGERNKGKINMMWHSCLDTVILDSDGRVVFNSQSDPSFCRQVADVEYIIAAHNASVTAVQKEMEQYRLDAVFQRERADELEDRLYGAAT